MKIHFQRGEVRNDAITATGGGNLRPTSILTEPYPGFPTDLHPQFAAFLSVVPGTSRIEETVFESRFAYASELMKMGARISSAARRATIVGVAPREFSGVRVWLRPQVWLSPTSALAPTGKRLCAAPIRCAGGCGWRTSLPVDRSSSR